MNICWIVMQYQSFFTATTAGQSRHRWRADWRQVRRVRKEELLKKKLKQKLRLQSESDRESEWEKEIKLLWHILKKGNMENLTHKWHNENKKGEAASNLTDDFVWMGGGTEEWRRAANDKKLPRVVIAHVLKGRGTRKKKLIWMKGALTVVLVFLKF